MNRSREEDERREARNEGKKRRTDADDEDEAREEETQFQNWESVSLCCVFPLSSSLDLHFSLSARFLIPECNIS